MTVAFSLFVSRRAFFVDRFFLSLVFAFTATLSYGFRARPRRKYVIKSRRYHIAHRSRRLIRNRRRRRSHADFPLFYSVSSATDGHHDRFHVTTVMRLSGRPTTFAMTTATAVLWWLLATAAATKYPVVLSECVRSWSAPAFVRKRLRCRAVGTYYNGTCNNPTFTPILPLVHRWRKNVCPRYT